MDKIFINNLNLNAIIGIKEYEKYDKQPIIIDLELGIDVTATATKLDLKYSIDYDKLANWLKEICENRSFGLLESLADFLATNILTEFNSPWLRLKITKPQAINATKHVGVIIERSRQ